jgi:glycopeptide antibiotics resistance protein
MAVRMALFRTASKEPKDKPKAAQPRTKAQSRTKAQPRIPAQPGETSPATTSAGKRSGTPAKASKAAPPAAGPRFSLRPKARSKPAPKPASRPAAATAPVPETAAERPYTPVLQRRSWGATLARFLVLTVAIVCMVAFAVALAKVTLVPSPSSDALIHTNLKPGDSIRTYLDQPNVRDTVKQIGGNILLGVPFGILLPMLFPKARGLLRVAVLTALVMLLVETAQGAIVEGRAFDIDDVILNTTGALIGYLLLGLRLGRALYPRRHHWWQRRPAGENGVRQDRRPVRKRP